MKSVGEVMAIGRTFKESIQKALCSLETDLSGFDEIDCDIQTLKAEIRRPNDKRVLYVAQGFRDGLSIDDIFELSKIDRWFLTHIKEIVDFEKNIDTTILQDESRLRIAKTYGFSDIKIAQLINKNDRLSISQNDIYNARKTLEISLEYNEVDTCGAEFKALTPYLYSSTNITKLPQITQDKTDDKKILIIGGGPNRIGQGIEFDYCCVHAAYAVEDMGAKTIMYNCNPETVSTDYDTSDILYFEPIDFEHVRSVIERENPDGVIVHFGGQTPLKLAKELTAMGAKIIGTPAKVIDTAEDRELFSTFVEQNGLLQPQNGTATTKDEALAIANRITYPVLVRPSFVLGGRAMKIVYSDKELNSYMDEAVSVSHESPVLVDKFLDRAIELDVDAICDGKDVYIGGIMQHIEEAGIHSGDSACSLPSLLDEKITKEIEDQTKKIALNLGVIGLLNIQYAIHKNDIYLIEVNPRASRTVPFVSKATSIPLAKVATKVMVEGSLLKALEFYDRHNVIYQDNGVFKPKLKDHISVKEAVFPFNKLTGADLILGPEMKSTGEVMGISNNFGMSFAKAQFGAKNNIPLKGKVFISLTDLDKPYTTDLARGFDNLGFEIVATEGTFNILKEQNISATKVLKISEGRPNIADCISNGDIDLVINTSDNRASRSDASTIRQMVIKNSIPYFTTLSAANATIEAIKELQSSSGETNPKALQDYLR
jgi:carbamoyl-phosphate synthase large subunit